MKYNILHVGCNDGDDHIYKFCQENCNSIESIVLVDANPKCLIEARKRYEKFDNCYLECFAVLPITCEDYKINFYLPEDEELSQSASIDKNFTQIHDIDKKIVKICTNTISMSSLLEKYNKTTMLSIDTEGLDVMNLFSLSQGHFTNISKIIFEAIHSDGTFSKGGPKLNALIYYLKQLGFKEFRNEEFNIICEK